MHYRREIDGLRALAVIPVILFHAGFGIFSGGFVGVDVFFVISGYLITTILLNDIEHGNFSIVKFYERRARRILPALFFVMLVCLPFAWLWMLPGEMVDFSKSIFSVSLFSSNLYFMTQDNYFSPKSELQPLLHTWSLAVEEQYYLFFPPLLSFLMKKGKARALIIIFTIFFASFVFSEWASSQNALRNYFFSAGRFWELLAGSIAAFVSLKWGVQRSEFLSALGLAAVFASIFLFDSSTPFPSVYAIIPVLGAVFFILFAERSTLAARLLSGKLLVSIGLISYSAYLWHQPIFAFARIRSLHEPNQFTLSVLSAAAMGLGALTWRYVETPFRKTSIGSTRNRSYIFAGSIAGLILFSSIGLVGFLSAGFPSRVSAVGLSILATKPGDTSGCHNALDTTEIESGADCRIGKVGVEPSIAILGDSHAASMTNALSEYLIAENASAVTFNGSWCAPIMNFSTNTKYRDDCLDKVNAAYRQVLDRDEIKTVILFAEWTNYTTGLRFGEDEAASYLFREDKVFDWQSASSAGNEINFRAGLQYTLDKLSSSKKHVIIVLPVPEQRYEVLASAARRELIGANALELDSLSEAEYFLRSGSVIGIIREIAIRYNVDVADPRSYFCEKEICKVVDVNGDYLYSDSNHVTYFGGLKVVESVRHFLD